MTNSSHPFFVPSGDNRRDTAILLVGTADEFGIDQRAIRTTRDGFLISEPLAVALGVDTSAEPETVSGNEDEPVLTGQVPVPDPEPEAAPEPEPKKSTRKKSTSKTNASGNRAGENEE